jgi:hypothetical protein
MRHKDDFGFSRLLLLLGGGLGVWGIFKPFYSLPQYDTQVSAFDLVQQWGDFFQGTNKASLVFGLLTGAALPHQILFAILLLLPLFLSVVALELVLRSMILWWRVQHRAWIFVVVSLVGVFAGLGLRWSGAAATFYFFEHIQGGYWIFLTMVIFSLAAKFSDE